MVAGVPDSELLTTLFSAAYHGKLDIVKSIVKDKGVSADAADAVKGSTALQWACYGGSLEVVEWLVKVGGAKVTHKNKDDRSALFFACEHCHKPVAAFLVSQPGVDINEKDGPSGHAPLHRACIAGQTRDQAGAKEMISWLLTSAGADPELKDRNGKKPGEADLAQETPKLKPVQLAKEIQKMLEEARTGQPSIADEKSRPAKSTPVPVAEPVDEPLPKISPVVAGLVRPGTSPSRPSVAARAAMLSRPSGSPTSSKKPARTTSPTSAPVPVTMNRSASPSKKRITRLQEHARTTAAPAAEPGSKPLPRGVFSRPGGTLPVTPSSAPPGSPRATASATSATRASDKAKTGGSPTKTPAASAGRPSYLRSSSTKGIGVTDSSGTKNGLPSSPSKSSSMTSEGNTVATGRYNPRSPPGVSDAPAISKSKVAVAARYEKSVTTSRPTSAQVMTTSSKAPAAVRYHRSVAGGTSAPMAHDHGQRPLSTPNPASKGSAEAIIAASNGPKASALAAAFETKARNRQGLPAPRRADSGLSATALAKRAPALSNTGSKTPVGGGSGGSRGNGNGVTASGVRGAESAQTGRVGMSKPPLAEPSAAPATRVTPEELLGTGSVSQKTKVYMAATQRSSQANPKDSSASSTGKAKKSKEPSSFMDKFVSMFSISPQSSRESSPARSPSRSPNRVRSKSPHVANTKNVHEQPRLGFFHSNSSFKASKEKE